VLTLTRTSGGAITVFWSAVPGKTYNVEFKDRADDPNWNRLAAGIRATTSTGSVIDNSNNAPGHRFYRVVLAQ